MKDPLTFNIDIVYTHSTHTPTKIKRKSQQKHDKPIEISW